MKLTRYERETHICFNEEEPCAIVYTYNKRLQKQLAELLTERPDDVMKVSEDNTGAVTYHIPKKWVKLRANRLISPEEKARIAERLGKHTQRA